MARNLVCSECGGEMQEGFIADYAYADRMILPSRWVAGSPEIRSPSFWGIYVDLRRLINNQKEKYYITTYRCNRCGFLKLYAGSDQPADE